ncbi:hypothetical protein, partial [Legionella pneumophila]
YKDISLIPENENVHNFEFIRGEKTFYIRPKGANCNLNKIKLSQISEFKRLKEALQQFSPVSIDNFIRDNPSFAPAGKIMIVYTLLKLEKPEKLELNDGDHWYPYLLNDILEGCSEKPSNINKSNLEIITFNYDVSLDYYLNSRLSEIERLKERYPERLYLKNFKIQHVYGSLFGDEPYDYGKYSIQGNGSDIANLKRFEASVLLHKNIKTMFEDRKKKKLKFKKMIERNEQIIVIGFGFDRSNLNQLGFPKIISSKESDINDSYIKFLKNKTFRYLNYGGEMTNLDYEFDLIQEEFKKLSSDGYLRIVKSHAKKITAAYFRDFKSTLLAD